MSSIHEYLGLPEKWPIIENIKYSITLMPNKDDIKSANRLDPKACALHNAACRTFNIPNCAIGARHAYIPQRDGKGRYYIARLMAPAQTRDAIKKFDKTGEMPEGGFVFHPCPKSQTLKSMRIHSRAQYERMMSGAKIRKIAKRKKKMVVVRRLPTGVHST